MRQRSHRGDQESSNPRTSTIAASNLNHNMSSSSSSKQKVVIIGYGGAGSQFAAYASKIAKYSVTVITPFDYMEVSLSMTKVIASNEVDHNTAIFPLLREENVEYVIDHVTSLQDDSVTISNGTSIPFDVCVVAVGHDIPYFFPHIGQQTMADRKAAVAEIQRRIREAKHVVVAGGGPIGTEACADIKLRHPNVK